MKKIIFILFLGCYFSGFTQSKRIDKLIAKQVNEVFNVDSYIKQSVAISEEINNTLPVKITDDNFFKISTENSFLGYYYLGRAYGKADYFDFIVIFDEKLIVSKVKILIYREDHGGEVGSRRWLKQFKGKTTNDNLKYQKDIAAISGATLSARSMTNEVNKLLKTIGILLNQQQL
ncbi:MAG: FMN-binding protein [Lutibacter sp.]|nr:FMN-binding protein [Lutibacter sp.]